jgi:hypothetical protein
MESAESHLLEYVDLAQKLVALKVAVPSPEGSAAVFAGGVLKQLFVKLFTLSVLVVDHFLLLCLLFFEFVGLFEFCFEFLVLLPLDRVCAEGFFVLAVCFFALVLGF